MGQANQASQNFEQALERLETVVKELESAETGLDRSLALYEQAVELLKRCRSILDSAEQKIRLLTGVDAQGNPITEPIDAASTAQRDAGGRAEPSERGKRTQGRGSRRAGGGDQLF